VSKGDKNRLKGSELKAYGDSKLWEEKNTKSEVFLIEAGDSVDVLIDGDKNVTFRKNSNESHLEIEPDYTGEIEPTAMNPQGIDFFGSNIWCNKCREWYDGAKYKKCPDCGCCARGGECGECKMSQDEVTVLFCEKEKKENKG